MGSLRLPERSKLREEPPYKETKLERAIKVADKTVVPTVDKVKSTEMIVQHNTIVGKGLY